MFPYYATHRTGISADAPGNIREKISAIEESIRFVESSLDKERAAFQHDRFGRRASEMPSALRELYLTSQWRHNDVYLWQNVLKHSVTGHHLAEVADAALDRLRYRPQNPLSQPFDANIAIKEAHDSAVSMSHRVRDALLTTRRSAYFKRRHDAREYMFRRRAWHERLKHAEQQLSPEEVNKKRNRDRQLLVATRARSGMGASMSAREVDEIFDQIEMAGGTAGGLERWGRSITAIPDHNPHALPPTCDGGGVLIADPLAYHYMCRNINPWTRSERYLFLEKFLIYGKNFRKISQFFEHKGCEDVVRFYFDNKKQLKLKQLLKDQGSRKKGARKNTLLELSRLPRESRSIRDNFIYQEGFESDDDDTILDWSQPDPLTVSPVGRSWSPADRQALTFALCRYDVSEDDESGPLPVVWTNVASVVKTKTPRQCRQFYFQFKSLLRLQEYRPPKLPPPSVLNPRSRFLESIVESLIAKAEEKSIGTAPTSFTTKYIHTTGTFLAADK